MKYLSLLLVVLLIMGCSERKNSSPFEPLYYQQWAINYNANFYQQQDIDPDAHLHGSDYYENYTGKGIRIAVIDNGFDVEHPEIQKHIVSTLAVDTDGVITGEDVNHLSSSGFHGTSVAGIIAAAKNGQGVRGVAPDVELILIRMPMQITDAAEITMFHKAVELGADIINCSWGTYSVTQTVRDYVNEIVSNGTAVVFAAGNDNSTFATDEASISNVISVGATDHGNWRAFYSNYGVELDLMAPGGTIYGITTIDPLAEAGLSIDGYTRFDERRDGEGVYFIGTSAAAPLVSGAIAMAMEKNSSVRGMEVFEKIKLATDQIGENAPYLDEMISSSSQTPTVTGILGETGFDQFNVYFVSHQTDQKYGPYSIVFDGDNRFSATAADILPQGDYSVELVSLDGLTRFATDEQFEINSSKFTVSNQQIKKSDYYGYGKLNISKLMEIF